MESFCIDALIIGSEKHLVCTSDGYSWRTYVPDNIWHLSGDIKPESNWCLDSVLRLGNTKLNLLPSQSFVTAAKSTFINHNVDYVPWQKILSPTIHRAFVKNVIDQVVESLNNLPTKYYRETWVPSYGVLRTLEPAKIDSKRFQSLIDEKVGNVHVVETFRPNSDGFANNVIYDRFGSLTGRLTVSEGPNILTLKRDYRDIIVSSFVDGKIMYVDFGALEVRILLYEIGKRCEASDLYESIAQELGYERQKVKAGVISELYGISKNALGKTLQIEGKELDKFIKQIKAYFNTGKLLARIKEQFVKSGFIVNRYGRPICVDEPLDHIFINYYAQSSGVDVALLGFSKIVDELKQSAPEIRSLFSLHDALLLDVPPQHIDLVSKIDHVTVPGYVQSFNVKVTNI